MNLHLFVDALSVVLIDLILGGDNAVVIALAVRALPKAQRARGIAVGAGCAVILRVAVTFFASWLLRLHFVQLAGGALILWIAVKVFQDAGPAETAQAQVRTFWKAVWLVVIADITMSTDNILAVAATAHGNLPVLILGLGLSIPCVVLSSSLLSILMEKYPVVIYLGAAILGRVGAQMMLTDAFTLRMLHPSDVVLYCAEGAAAAGVVVIGKLRRNTPAPVELAK